MLRRSPDTALRWLGALGRALALIGRGSRRLGPPLAWLWRSLQPRLDRWYLALAGVFLVMEVCQLAVIYTKSEFDFEDGIVALFFARKILVDLSIFSAGNFLLLKICRHWLPAALFSLVHLAFTAIDTGIYLWGNTLFVHHHVDFLTWYALRGFIGLPFLAMTAAVLGLAAAAAILLQRMRLLVRWGSILKWAALAVAGVLLNPNDYIYKFVNESERLDYYVFRFRNTQLEYSTQNTMINFVNEAFIKKEQRLARVVDSDQSLRPVIDRYRLPIGPRRYPPLDLKPFNKIVFFTTESLSLDLIGAFNSKLPLDPTPFFLSTPAIRDRTFSNFRTTAQPTLPGLSVLFTSHPNFELPRATGYRNSFVRMLRDRGYHTVFLRSASRYYADENIVLKNFGYDEIVAREDFYDRPEMRKYVYGWGLEDRLLYQELIAMLERSGDRKLFVTVLGTDTHPPHGQEHYRHLQYPPLPPEFRMRYGPEVARFLKAVYYFDYDLRNMVETIERRGLLRDDTLLIISADHSCPFNHIVQALPGYPRTSVERVPLIFLTPQSLPPTDFGQRSSQLDFAPTLFHLLGLPIPAGWWGESLFYPGRRDPVIGFDAGMFFYDLDGKRTVHDFSDPDRAEPRDLFELFNTLVSDEQ
ncbi:MAG: LTA synthase family protein [Deltaproteobacteria bacterium]|nr:LTA synthase family protein [Deltaproteobacteria bacterium]